MSRNNVDRAVNERWMEALDTTTGRVYFLELEMNDAGEVRPTGSTAWEPPPGFLTRNDLLAALLDDDAFLARVRQRFPPPATPPLENKVWKQGASSLSSVDRPPTPPAWAMSKVGVKSE